MQPPEPLLIMERAMGIEPTQPAWKAGVLPLYYARECRYYSRNFAGLQANIFRENLTCFTVRSSRKLIEAVKIMSHIHETGQQQWLITIVLHYR